VTAVDFIAAALSPKVLSSVSISSAERRRSPHRWRRGAFAARPYRRAVVCRSRCSVTSSWVDDPAAAGHRLVDGMDDAAVAGLDNPLRGFPAAMLSTISLQYCSRIEVRSPVCLRCSMSVAQRAARLHHVGRQLVHPQILPIADDDAPVSHRTCTGPATCSSGHRSNDGFLFAHAHSRKGAHRQERQCATRPADRQSEDSGDVSTSAAVQTCGEYSGCALPFG
jgi:hypothetical protein